MEDPKNREIFLVEDNPADARLIVEVFDGFKVKNNLTIATDGAEAMEYLNKEGKYMDRKCPSMIILDLNLPKKDGREILEDIKKDKKLRKIPVIVLTTSQDENDINCAYCHYASAYLTKPNDFNEFMSLISSLEDFWFKWGILPKCMD